MNKLNKAYLGAAVVIATVLGLGGTAFAVDPTPAESATTLATAGVTALTPVILAVATAAVTLAVLSFAVRKVFRMIGSGGRKV
jgi:hypothetical protein